MSIAEMLLPEFDQEMACARRLLERLPGDRFGWKPHAKSFPLGHLATHLANIPGWAPMVVGSDSVDVAPPGQPPLRTVPLATPAEILEAFDRNAAAAREAIGGASDDHLGHPWALLSGGKEVFSIPRSAALRTFVMSHLIHHRAQLGVYLRLLDLPVPSTYGPTADEGPH